MNLRQLEQHQYIYHLKNQRYKIHNVRDWPDFGVGSLTKDHPEDALCLNDCVVRRMGYVDEEGYPMYKATSCDGLISAKYIIFKLDEGSDDA